jgi:uncharacterized protein (TIGR02246 family)
MSSQRLSPSRLALFGGLAVAAIGFAFVTGRQGDAGQPPADPVPAAAAPPAAAVPVAAKAAGEDAPANRPPDRAAINKALDEFSAAFQKGDAKVVAGLWTAEGEYTCDDGTTFTGRAALEKAYTEFFAKNPDNALDVDVDSIRFPSRDTAVVEGHFKLHKGKKKELIVSRCSFLYTREDGKWLIAIAREWPSDGLALRDLEWIIGSWEAKRDGTVVTTKYEWTANKSFIRCHFSITKDGKTQSGMQMFAKDPVTGVMRNWTFEDDGGIGETEITRDGKKWVFAATGATSEGRELTSTNILTPVDADTFLWQATGRSLDGEELPDLPPIKVTRVKAKQ